MARQSARSDSRLPTVRQSYPQYVEETQVELSSPRLRNRSNPNVSYMQSVEGRLAFQEETIQKLLDRAYKVKEDIIDVLGITQHSWQEEKRARQLLQDHIQTITDVVRKLSRNIENIEDELNRRNNNNTPRRFENVNNTSQSQMIVDRMHNVYEGRLSEVRTYLINANAQISRLNADLRNSQDANKQLQSQIQQMQTQFQSNVSAMEERMRDLTNKLDMASRDHTTEIRQLEHEANSQMNGLDSTTRTALEDVKRNIHTLQMTQTLEHERLSNRLTSFTEKEMAALEMKQEKEKRKQEEAIEAVMRQLGAFSDRIDKIGVKVDSVEKQMERTLNEALNAEAQRLDKQVGALRKECHAGLKSVHETMSSMKEINDSKVAAVEDRFKKDLGRLRKMIVLV